MATKASKVIPFALSTAGRTAAKLFAKSEESKIGAIRAILADAEKAFGGKKLDHGGRRAITAAVVAAAPTINERSFSAALSREIKVQGWVVLAKDGSIKTSTPRNSGTDGKIGKSQPDSKPTAKHVVTPEQACAKVRTLAKEYLTEPGATQMLQFISQIEAALAKGREAQRITAAKKKAVPKLTK